MAEGFARVYGRDILAAASAGLWPAQGIARDTHLAMQEKNIDLSGHYPKKFDPSTQDGYDVIVNMSGLDIAEESGGPPPPAGALITWNVQDPVSLPLAEHRRIRDQIEGLVMRLIMDLRKKSATAGQ
jgi:arsenate reductase (thioredoxin)